MNFSLIDKPFGGIFTVNLRVTSLLSNGHIGQNLASFYGNFEFDENVRLIEDYLNKAIKNWYETGLKYQ